MAVPRKASMLNLACKCLHADISGPGPRRGCHMSIGGNIRRWLCTTCTLVATLGDAMSLHGQITTLPGRAGDQTPGAPQVIAAFNRVRVWLNAFEEPKLSDP